MTAMKVCVVGTFAGDDGDPRSRVLLEGLRRAGVEVVECRRPIARGAESRGLALARFPRNLRMIGRVLRAYAGIARDLLRRRNRADVMLVGAAGYPEMVMAKAAAALRGEPVVFDAFVSLHETLVQDRGVVPADSMKARLLASLERLAVRSADAVLLDTEAQVAFFADRMDVDVERFHCVPVGEEYPGLAASEDSSPARLDVLYFGTYIPLHGVETIVEAARRFDGDDRVRFTLIGDGQTFGAVAERAQGLSNVHLERGWRPKDELFARLRRAHVALGIFADSPKADRVMPCKVYAALGLGIPVITRDSTGAREFLRDGETALLVKPGDPDAIAAAIVRLRDDADLRMRLGRAGRALYEERFRPERIGAQLRAVLEEVANRHARPRA
ncbi:MAG: glycosyltransferase family 4 protein [Planctomycetes bacterium]|nr:glycosyltransferase family 4 protein [Planctomycetota bacterium]